MWNLHIFPWYFTIWPFSPWRIPGWGKKGAEVVLGLFFKLQFWGFADVGPDPVDLRHGLFPFQNGLLNGTCKENSRKQWCNGDSMGQKNVGKSNVWPLFGMMLMLPEFEDSRISSRWLLCTKTVPGMEWWIVERWLPDVTRVWMLLFLII